MTDINEFSALVFLHFVDIAINNLLAQLRCGHVLPDAISFIGSQCYSACNKCRLEKREEKLSDVLINETIHNGAWRVFVLKV